MTGRPREFCLDQALERALEVFWRQGYEGASLSDLTEAMGITRPSLYAAFGNKELLFRKALDRYEERRTASLVRALEEPTSRGVVEQLLMGLVEADPATDAPAPKGCLIVQGALACSEAGEPIRAELCARRTRREERLRDRLKELKSEGDLPEDADPDDLARYVMAVANGLAVHAAGGSSGPDLRKVVETTLRGWPARPSSTGTDRQSSVQAVS